MRDHLSRNFLIVAGLVFVATGLTFSVAPELVGAIREQGGHASADSINDVRAIYGALEVGFGIFLLLCGRRPGLHDAGLLAAVIAGGAMALSRFVGFALLAGTPAAHLGYGALDLLGVALAAFALRRRAGEASAAG